MPPASRRARAPRAEARGRRERTSGMARGADGGDGARVWQHVFLLPGNHAGPGAAAAGARGPTSCPGRPGPRARWAGSRRRGAPPLARGPPRAHPDCSESAPSLGAADPGPARPAAARGGPECDPEHVAPHLGHSALGCAFFKPEPEAQKQTEWIFLVRVPCGSGGLAAQAWGGRRGFRTWGPAARPRGRLLSGCNLVSSSRQLA